MFERGVREYFSCYIPHFYSTLEHQTQALIFTRTRLLFICLLALVLENYQVRPEDLREDLHVPLSKVREYFRELGCVSRSSTDVVEGGNISTGTKKRKRTDIMVLQVPLVFPARRRAR